MNTSENTGRLGDCFRKVKSKKRAVLVTYVMGCDPDYLTSLEIIKKLPESGADIIELGMPFSDPMADGPTIQEAGQRALKAGATVGKIIEIVAKLREQNRVTPLILMGYYNPIFHYGIKNFVRDVVQAGVDGVIIVDLPPEEEAEFIDIAIPSGLSLVKLVTPTTDGKRLEKVLKNASGFVYLISVAGITGTKSAKISDIKKYIAAIKKKTTLPVAVGFGIKTPEQAAEIAKIADGVVVGSAIVEKVKENLGNGRGITENILSFVAKIKSSMKP